MRDKKEKKTNNFVRSSSAFNPFFKKNTYTPYLPFTLSTKKYIYRYFRTITQVVFVCQVIFQHILYFSSSVSFK